jgi:hypothetical protein
MITSGFASALLTDSQGAFDIYVFAHVVGWFGKSTLTRDYWFTWVTTSLPKSA